MRQISILLLTVLAISAAQPNKEQISKQLNETIIPKVGNLNGFTIEEMIQVLYKNSNKINFLYFPPKPKVEPAVLIMPPQIGGGLDPLGNQFPEPFPPVNFAPQAPIKKEPETPTMKIITGDLNNLTIKQFMDIMIMGCVPPIQYIVMDYGVVFLPQEKDKAYMPFRLYRLNKNPFLKNE